MEGISALCSGGGGGGRIALYYTDATAFNLSHIVAFGGSGFATGQDGSVFLAQTNFSSNFPAAKSVLLEAGKLISV